jgi:isopenicillin-N epimerase
VIDPSPARGPGSGLRALWALDPDVVFLNHGSFGATPRAVLEDQERWRVRMEADPVRFFVRDLDGLLAGVRAALGGFLGADPDDLALVANATAGVNTVLRSLRLEAGDEIVVTDQEYNACRNALNVVAADSGARVVVVRVPFPLASSEEVVGAVLGGVTPRTRLALLDHGTSATGLVLPIEQLVCELDARSVDTLVDGAHGPGMVPLNLRKLGAAYYTGNCHKWLCAPKGAAFLHVRADRQQPIRPLVISHGANSPRADRSRFLLEFGWMGTDDPSAWLSVPEALRCVGGLLPGGWPEVMRRNRELALTARRLLCEALAVPLPAPDAMIGSLASIPLPDAQIAGRAAILHGLDAMRDELLREFQIEVPVFPWPAPPQRVLRISAQLYNLLPDYERLASAVKVLLGKRETQSGLSRQCANLCAE